MSWAHHDECPAWYCDPSLRRSVCVAECLGRKIASRYVSPFTCVGATSRVASPSIQVAAMVKQKNMSQTEVELAKRWYKEDGKGGVEIGELLRHSRRTVLRHVTFMKQRRAKVGRPAMSAQDYAKCERALASLQKKAKGESEVTEVQGWRFVLRAHDTARLQEAWQAFPEAAGKTFAQALRRACALPVREET